MADSGNGGATGDTLAQVKAMLNNSSLLKKTKTAPPWKHEEPEQLVLWLDDLDAIFETANITNNWVKIQKVLEWIEYATKNEMSGLESAKKSHLEANWEEFKKKLTA
uniref:Retrotransposon gag domain-containing protein n=1 Tax=Moniliophthora roreri TaxID=221103 RepID=A0A0W0FDZ9_MONRR